MPYIDLAHLSDDPDFRLRVRTAVTQYAQTVNGEAVGAMTPGLWKGRSQTAVSILLDPDMWAMRFARAIVASNIGMTANDSDAVIQANVNIAFNKLAYAQALG